MWTDKKKKEIHDLISKVEKNMYKNKEIIEEHLRGISIFNNFTCEVIFFLNKQNFFMY